jgi:hypothetical protein
MGLIKVGSGTYAGPYAGSDTRTGTTITAGVNLDIDVQGLGTVNLLIVNTGSTNSLDYTVTGSLSGADFLVVEKALTTVAQSANSQVAVTKPYKTLRVNVKSTGAAAHTTYAIYMAGV